MTRTVPAIHRVLASQHDAMPGCPVKHGKHISLECSCGWLASVLTADDIAWVIRQHGGVWAKHEMETA
jgi:hypothetical protein